MLLSGSSGSDRLPAGTVCELPGAGAVTVDISATTYLLTEAEANAVLLLRRDRDQGAEALRACEGRECDKVAAGPSLYETLFWPSVVVGIVVGAAASAGIAAAVVEVTRPR